MTPEQERELSEIFATPVEEVPGSNDLDLHKPEYDDDEPRDPEDIQCDIDELLEDLSAEGWQYDDEKKAQLYFELAELYNELCNMEKEERALEEGLNFNPDHPEMNHMKGMILLEKEYYEEALPYLKKAVQRDPNHSDYLSGYGLCLSHCGDQRAAIDHLRRAHEIDPEDIQTLLALSDCYEETENIPGQIDCAKKVCALQPDNEEFQKLLESLEVISRGEEPNTPQA